MSLVGSDICAMEHHVMYARWTWWRHQMETFSVLLALCVGNSPVTHELPTQMPVTPSFDVFFALRLGRQFSKQSRGWWFETPSRSLWLHGNTSCNAFLCTLLCYVYVFFCSWNAFILIPHVFSSFSFSLFYNCLVFHHVTLLIKQFAIWPLWSPCTVIKQYNLQNMSIKRFSNILFRNMLLVSETTSYLSEVRSWFDNPQLTTDCLGLVFQTVERSAKACNSNLRKCA